MVSGSWSLPPPPLWCGGGEGCLGFGWGAEEKGGSEENEENARNKLKRQDNIRNAYEHMGKQRKTEETNEKTKEDEGRQSRTHTKSKNA